jgi:hypothetical protein
VGVFCVPFVWVCHGWVENALAYRILLKWQSWFDDCITVENRRFYYRKKN